MATQAEVITEIEHDLFAAWAQIQSLTVGWGPEALQQLTTLAEEIARLA